MARCRRYDPVKSALMHVCSCFTKPSAHLRAASEDPLLAPTGVRLSSPRSYPLRLSPSTVSVTTSITTAPTVSEKYANSGATCLSSSKRTHGCEQWALRVSPRRPTFLYWETITWKKDYSQSEASLGLTPRVRAPAS